MSVTPDQNPFHAPVILDASTESGIQPLLSLVRTIKKTSNTVTAEVESNRLMPYFNAMSAYLNSELTDCLENPDDEKEMRELITPDGLKNTFNQLAAITKNTLMSEVIIVPSDLFSGPGADTLAQLVELDFSYDYRSRRFGFGFLQMFERKHGIIERFISSTTFPTFTIDRDMIASLPKNMRQPVLSGIQELITIVNHDYLHHYTADAINRRAAEKFGNYRCLSPEASRVHNWYEDMRKSGDYEAWAQVAYEKAFLHPQNENLVKTLTEKFDAFFGTLSALPRDATSKNSDMIDYFGTVALHIASRVFPLNHPVMAYCIDCLEKIDPLAQTRLRDYNFDLARTRLNCGVPWGVIRGYRNIGVDILWGRDSYQKMKNADLLFLSDRQNRDDLGPHIPSDDDRWYGAMRQHAPCLTLAAVFAAAKDAGCVHSPDIAFRKTPLRKIANLSV